MKVYVETPVEEGIHIAEIFIPGYQWYQIVGIKPSFDCLFRCLVIIS